MIFKKDPMRFHLFGYRKSKFAAEPRAQVIRDMTETRTLRDVDHPVLLTAFKLNGEHEAKDEATYFPTGRWRRKSFAGAGNPRAGDVRYNEDEDNSILPSSWDSFRFHKPAPLQLVDRARPRALAL